jgi:predicted chitinase
LLPENAVLTSCWFWSKHKLNQLADVSDMTAITKKVTGGSTALDQRLALYKAILASLG